MAERGGGGVEHKWDGACFSSLPQGSTLRPLCQKQSDQRRCPLWGPGPQCHTWLQGTGAEGRAGAGLGDGAEATACAGAGAGAGGGCRRGQQTVRMGGPIPGGEWRCGKPCPQLVHPGPPRLTPYSQRNTTIGNPRRRSLA